MSERNVIQATVDEFGRMTGATNRSGSWYRGSSEMIVVLNLQKSNYSVRYYLNVAV